ncbi:hypothetical protein BDV34DRAFT_113510 [Aspergillus parasiticus]|uniref:Uncharacterized protein n=1 Tax=Aspergillus parasiticus TaxID=5067 RepID=A0A5N6DJQ8_ASPPA|nr:hypothetical protein BDV34DRAFT_113510 [Aspergillus parasiticus]
MNGMGQPLSYAPRIVWYLHGYDWMEMGAFHDAHYYFLSVNGLNLVTAIGLPYLREALCCFRFLVYVLAMTTSSYRKVFDTPSIILLVVSGILLAAFPVWINCLDKNSKTCADQLWRHASFTSICTPFP